MPPEQPKPKLTLEKGIVKDTRVHQALVARIDHGPLGTIHAIVVHQTNSSNAKGTLATYASDSREAGAHFLIDKDGTIYQTVPVNRKAWHVGKLRSKCVAVHNCDVDQAKLLAAAGKIKGTPNQNRAINNIEKIKSYPERYPANEDSIGIEIVGKWLGDDKHKDVVDYEPLTPAEKLSLKYLIDNLVEALNLKRTDIYRHPLISAKTEGEARDASW